MINDALLKAVEKELEKSPWQLKFTKDVEARFEADTQHQRSRNMVVAGLIAASVYSLFLINDYSFRPDSFLTAVQLRMGVMLPIGLTILWWVYRGVAPVIRETLMAITVVVAMLVSCLIFATSTEPYSYLDVFSFGLILVVGNIIYPLRFGYACVSSGIGVLIMLVFIVVYEPMPLEVKRLAMFSIVAKALFTLFANFRLERSERTAYLLVLKEKIRSGYYLKNNRKLSRLSVTDPLTNIANRRQFDTIFPLRWQEAIDKHNFLGLMVIDIDYFKAYNDYYGHLQGDQCLRQVATTIQANSRDTDLVVRFGGEEFVVLMPNATLNAVRQAAERIRCSIEALSIPNYGCSGQRVVTVSIGVAMLCPTEHVTPDGFLANADAALYEAKKQGRNCICMANVE